MNWRDKRSAMTAKVLVPMGLFITSGTFLLSHDWVKLPDALSGGLTGFGIGIMIVGVVRMKKKSKCADEGQLTDVR